MGKSNKFDTTTSSLGGANNCKNDGWRFSITKFPSERVYIQNSPKCWKGAIGDVARNGGTIGGTNTGFWRKINGKWKHIDPVDGEGVACGVQKIRQSSISGTLGDEDCATSKSNADPNAIYIKMERHNGCKAGGSPFQPPSPKNQSLCASSSCHKPSMHCVTRKEEHTLQTGEGAGTGLIFKAGKVGDCFDKCSLPRNVLYHDPEYYCNALLAMGCPYDCKKCIGASASGGKITSLPSKSQLTQHKILCDTQENLDRLKPVEDPNCKDVYNDCSENLHFCTNVGTVNNCKKTCDKCN